MASARHAAMDVAPSSPRTRSGDLDPRRTRTLERGPVAGVRPGRGASMRPSQVPAASIDPGAAVRAATIVTGADREHPAGGVLTRTLASTQTVGPDAGTRPPPDAGTPAPAPTTPAPAAACTTTGTLTTPSGNLTPTMTGNRLGTSWDMSADFTPSQNTASCRTRGEYRQFVKGKMTVDGTTFAHDLGGVAMSETTFHEDRGAYGGGTVGYGHHSEPFPTSTFTRPDQATGTRWDGWDAPGIETSEAGKPLGLDLHFQGKLIDTSTGAELVTRSWSVVGTGVTPSAPHSGSGGP